MAAKKKAPAKKSAPKKTGGNTGSANAAEMRVYENKYRSQKVSVAPGGVRGWYQESLDWPVRGGKKTAMDARKRDVKYGKPISPTYVQATGPGPISQRQFTETLVQSAKGNKYVIHQEKRKRRFLPDTNSKPDAEPYQQPRKTPTRTQTVRSRQGRALNAAKTPTKRAAAKKKYN